MTILGSFGIRRDSPSMNDMVYVLVPGTLHGIRASDGVYSWRYDAQTSSNSLVSVSLGTAINRSVVFYPEVCNF